MEQVGHRRQCTISIAMMGPPRRFMELTDEDGNGRIESGMNGDRGKMEDN